MPRENGEINLYVAGPLGFSEAGRHFHNGVLIPGLQELGYGIIDPWKLTPQERIDQVLQTEDPIARKRLWTAVNEEIFVNNVIGIERADGIFVVLDGVGVDDGSSWEVGYGFGLDKPMLGYRGDFRPSGDNEGSIVNLMIEKSIRASGGTIINTAQPLPRTVLYNVFGEPGKVR